VGFARKRASKSPPGYLYTPENSATAAAPITQHDFNEITAHKTKPSWFEGS